MKFRPSPTTSATRFAEGAVRTGNDGNKWTVILTKDGQHRWRKIATKPETGKQTSIVPKTSQQKSKVKYPPSMRKFESDRIEWLKENALKLTALFPEEEPSAALRKMSRTKILRQLKASVEVWEKVSQRNQDLSDERLKQEDTAALASHLSWYMSQEAKALTVPYLIEVIRDLLKIVK